MAHPTSDVAGRDLAAAAAVRQHHAQLAAELERHTRSLLDLVDGDYLLKAERTRQDLLAFLRQELVPHALAEEGTLYPAAAARPEGKPLVDGMLDEHRAITALVDEVAGSASLIRAAAAARAVSTLFATHLAKENDLVLPMLAGAPDVSLADLLAGMHDLLGADAHEHDTPATGEDGAEPRGAAGGCGCGGCGCGSSGGDRPALVLSTVESRAAGEAVSG